MESLGKEKSWTLALSRCSLTVGMRRTVSQGLAGWGTVLLNGAPSQGRPLNEGVI